MAYEQLMQRERGIAEAAEERVDLLVECALEVLRVERVREAVQHVHQEGARALALLVQVRHQRHVRQGGARRRRRRCH